MTPPLPPPAPPPSGSPAPGPWHADPLERDRYLDGEGTPEERRSRQRDIAADPALAQRLAARAGFLTVLASAREAEPATNPLLVARVRAALETQGTSTATGARAGLLRRLRPWIAAAAVLLVALGAWANLAPRTAQALDPARLAASLLTWVPKGLDEVGGCAGASAGPAQSFVLVQRGELEIRACDPTPGAAGASRALLRRPEELPTLGFVAVPAPGVEPSSEVGITEVGPGGVVVFDVLDHGRRVYLALDAAALRVRHSNEGDRWTCAACHGPERQALPNPHSIVLRRAP